MFDRMESKQQSGKIEAQLDAFVQHGSPVDECLVNDVSAKIPDFHYQWCNLPGLYESYVNEGLQQCLNVLLSDPFRKTFRVPRTNDSSPHKYVNGADHGRLTRAMQQRWRSCASPACVSHCLKSPRVRKRAQARI